MTDEYRMLVELRNQELQVFWTRYNVFTAINSGLLGVLTIDDGASSLRWLLAGVVGGAVSTAWYRIHRRSMCWMSFWARELGRRENADGVFRAVQRHQRRVQPTLTDVAGVVPLVFSALWVVAAIVSGCLYLGEILQAYARMPLTGA